MRTLTLLLLAFVLVVGAETVIFQPDGAVGKDAFVMSMYPTANHGGAFYLSWGYWGYSGSDQRISFIEFIELNDTQYQGATVNSAILSLFVYNMSGDTNSGFYVLKCASSWDESTITWDNKPVGDAGITQDYPSGTGWMDIDITTWVQNWLDGTWTNYGFLFRNHPSSTANELLITYSSDYTDDPSLRPKLVMEYSGSAVEESTWGQIKATF